MRLYELVGNYGMAVILFALIVKVVLLPFQMKSKRSMMKTSRLQPQLKELQKKHGANKQKYNEEVSKLYKEEQISPMSGCLWSLIPFPIIIALFSAIRSPITIMMGVPKALLSTDEPIGAIVQKLTELNFTTSIKNAYAQIAQTEFISEHFDSFASIHEKLREIDYSFLGMNLGETPDYTFLWSTNWGDSTIWIPGLLLFMLPVVSGLLAFFSSRISMSMNSTGDPQQQSAKTMMLIMPFVSIYFAFIMPAAIGVYIAASTLFAMIQDIILTKKYKAIMEIEDAEKNERKRIKAAELEEKRLETERKKLENSTAANPNTSKKKQQKTERQDQLEKAGEWEKKNAPAVSEPKEEDPSRSGKRRFARGRAYEPTRFNDAPAADGDDLQIEESTTDSEDDKDA